jgi:hypothetical protein
MANPRWEHLLLDPVAKYLQRRGYCYQLPEIGFFEQKIDLYAYSEKARITLAVELKLRRWRDALRQALLYQLCADYAMIAIPASVIRSVEKDLLRIHGIGLIAVGDGKCQQVLAPEHSEVVRKRYRKAYIEMVKEAR